VEELHWQSGLRVAEMISACKQSQGNTLQNLGGKNLNQACSKNNGTGQAEGQVQSWWAELASSVKAFCLPFPSFHKHNGNSAVSALCGRLVAQSCTLYKVSTAGAKITTYIFVGLPCGAPSGGWGE
jgi:hypothetical protein